MSPIGRGGAGFTLLELLVTLTLASLVMMLVPPALDLGNDRGRLKSDTRLLADSLGLARSQAITAGREVPFTVDLDTRRYGVDRQTGTFDAGMAVEMNVAASDQLAAHRALIRFFPDGSSSGGEIRLGNTAGTAIVSVDWLTGRVTTARGPSH